MNEESEQPVDPTVLKADTFEQTSSTSEEPQQVEPTVDYSQFIDNLAFQGNKVGSGAEKVVYEHPNDPTKVVAVFKSNSEDADRIKRRFYVNKILHLLYPANIPDIHLASSKPMALILERAPGEQLERANLLKKLIYRKAVENLSHKLRKLGIGVDDNDVNFHLASRGDVQFVDGFIGDFSYEEENLISAARKRLSTDDQEKVLRYLARIKTLKPGIRS